MFATRSLLIIGIFCIGSVISEKVICDFENSKCLTDSAGLTFVQFISGVPGVESSEPLYAKTIEANHPTLSYKYIDAKLFGMKKCKVELVKISAKDLKYDYHIGCPQVTLEAGYELNGEVGPQHVEGKGDAKVDFYDIHFLFHGDYVNKDGKGGKSHINLKTHELEVQVKGKINFDFKNLFDGDKEKSDAAHKHVNDNWEPIATAYGKETMQPLMDKYIGNVNAYLDVVPVQDLFSYEKIYTKDQKYDYHLGCPHLILESGYDLKAETGTQNVEGKGTSKIDLYDYHLLFHGDFVLNEAKEGQIHLNLKTHELELKIKGKAHYNNKNLFIDDKTDALQRFANENWESVVKRTLKPIMTAFMNKQINNKNTYLAIVPLKEIFFHEK